MRPARRILRIILLVIVAALAWIRVRDPEDRTLDDAARRSAGGQFVRLTDGTTHFDVAGPDSGPKVVLVHGFSVPAYIWDSTVVALSGAGFRVARYDTYGRGFSDRPDARYDLDLYDRQLAGLLDSLGWREPVHVMGLSFGGPIVATFAGRHPERVRTLTLVDPVSGGFGAAPWYARIPALGPQLWQGIAVPTMADGQASDFVQPAKWPDWADRYRTQMHYRGFGRALLRTRVATHDLRIDSIYALAGKANRPTLLVWGEQDRTVPIANAAQVRSAIPQTEFHAIANAGHLPHMERTDVVDTMLVRFLRAH